VASVWIVGGESRFAWGNPDYTPCGLRDVACANLLYCSSLVSARGRHSRPPSQPGRVVRSALAGTLSTSHVHMGTHGQARRRIVQWQPDGGHVGGPVGGPGPGRAMSMLESSHRPRARGEGCVLPAMPQWPRPGRPRPQVHAVAALQGPLRSMWAWVVCFGLLLIGEGASSDPLGKKTAPSPAKGHFTQEPCHEHALMSHD
jgi:hypothetical protein